MCADARRREIRLGTKRPTTEDLTLTPDLTPEWGEGRKLPEKVSGLRRKLYQKAKREPKFRFYNLYGQVLRPDVLMAAWEQVRRNKGAPGVDGVTIHHVVHAEGGPEGFVQAIHEELRAKTYMRLSNTYHRKMPDSHVRCEPGEVGCHLAAAGKLWTVAGLPAAVDSPWTAAPPPPPA